MAFNNVCSTTASDGKPCLCEFLWNEVNSSNGGTAINIPRQVETTMTLSQSAVAVCNAPPNYTSIPNGTTVKITMIPGSGNPRPSRSRPTAS